MGDDETSRREKVVRDATLKAIYGSDFPLLKDEPTDADWANAPDVPVTVTATRADGEVVVQGTIRLWVTPKKKSPKAPAAKD